ncbi:MAG: FadR family transcriptional regulator [Nitrospirales bacterium]|jgi:DNA-binding FadR family transcriptional regulator|nr:MAG: FadR family transcriptional regulator [Nitrospirales bacterium]
MLSLPQGVSLNKKNILEHLARMIIDGTLATDTVLPNELAIGAHFGVSRTMIRDVLRSLEEKGLIERKTNSGTRVRNINSWNLLDNEVLDWSCGSLTQSRFLVSILELRLIVEPQAAALAAIRANDTDLQLIRDNLLRMKNAEMSTNGSMAFTEADIEFHKAIIKASGNLFVAQFGGAVRAALHHTIYLSNKASVDHRDSYECHRRVLDSIENRNAKGAYAAMGRVLRNTISDLGLQVTGVILSDRDSVVQGGIPTTVLSSES